MGFEQFAYWEHTQLIIVAWRVRLADVAASFFVPVEAGMLSD
jgi:hypothetical protein